MGQIYGEIHLLCAAGIAAVILLVLAILGGRKRAALRNLASLLNGTVHGSLCGYSMEGERQGLRYSMHLFCGSKSSPPSLEMTLHKPSCLDLRMSREDALHRMGKKLGLLREVRIEDASFDREYMISSGTPAQAKEYLSRRETRELLRNLFNDGFASFSIDADKVVLEKPNYSLEKDLAPQRVLRWLDELFTLATG